MITGLGKRVGMVLGAIIVALMWQPTAKADSYSVTIDSSSLQSSSAGPFGVFFEFLDASELGDSNNTATLTNFNLGGGSAGTAFPFGGGAGDMNTGITLTDSEPGGFNSVFVDLTPGSTLSFTLSMTANQDSTINPMSGLTGDEFVLQILDGNQDNVPTTDPMPTEDAFVVVSVCAGQSGCPTDGLLVQSYGIPGAAATTVVPITSAPEPGTLLLLFAGILALGILGFRARRRSLAPIPPTIA